MIDVSCIYYGLTRKTLTKVKSFWINRSMWEEKRKDGGRGIVFKYHKMTNQDCSRRQWIKKYDKKYFRTG